MATKKQYISKGIVGHPRKTPARGAEKIFNKIKAWKAGKPVKISIPREFNEQGNMIGSGEPKQWASDIWSSPQKEKRL